LNYKR